MSYKGFTLVELLIVIVVIAILAVIAIIGYNGVISQAQENSVKHDMKNIAKQLEVYKIDAGRYPSSSTLTSLGIKVNKQTYGVNPTGATIFYCVDSDGTTFSVVARVKSTKLLQFLSSTGQTTTYSGSATAPQLCLDSGVPGTTSSVTYTAFTENGSWYAWVN
jgi:prepilin-type N-terminal cleavage/methylation domain-containing protein